MNEEINTECLLAKIFWICWVAAEEAAEEEAS